MPDDPDLRPAIPAEVREALALALRFDGRKRRHDADGFLVAIAAERLVEHLRRAGFVVMKRPAAPAHKAPGS